MSKSYVLITLYNPNKKIVNELNKLVPQVDYIYLIDNTPNSDISEWFENYSNIKYIFNNANLGLSSAYNKILKKSTYNDDDIIIFFDQDFSIFNDYIKQLISSFTKNFNQNIGIMGPLIFDRNTNKKSVSRYVKDQSFSIVPRVITSSSITYYKILKQVGYWDEKLFLDWADFDLCYRIKSIGYKCAIDSNIILNHQLGDNSKEFLGKTYPYYSPIREYYQIRDGLCLKNKNTTPIKDKISMIYVCTIRFLIH